VKKKEGKENGVAVVKRKAWREIKEKKKKKISEKRGRKGERRKEKKSLVRPTGFKEKRYGWRGWAE